MENLKNIFTHIAAIIIILIVLAIVSFLYKMSGRYYIVNIFTVSTLYSGYLTFEYALNGSSLKRGLMFDYKMFNFGRFEKRLQYIKDGFKDSNLAICGSMKTWSNWDKDEIHDEQWYIDCTNDVFKCQMYYVWVSRVIIPICLLILITHLHY